jgi:YcaO-like protein with predicted kinase domain
MLGRSRTSSETWAAVQPLLQEIGITRVGDITGLDRIGIPVWIAVRPNSRTLSVSQGKGLDAPAARIRR